MCIKKRLKVQFQEQLILLIYYALMYFTATKHTQGQGKKSIQDKKKQSQRSEEGMSEIFNLDRNFLKGPAGCKEKRKLSSASF